MFIYTKGSPFNMQAHRIYALLVLSIIASIIHISWSVSIVTVALIALYAFSEYMLSQDRQVSGSIEKRLKDLEEKSRDQSFSKVFK
jgi:hypothetical protein